LPDVTFIDALDRDLSGSMNKTWLIVCAITFVAAIGYGSFRIYRKLNPPTIAEEIESFKEEDVKEPPPHHSILFVGSSSFRDWDVKEYFPGRKIINRGFGGATLLDVTQYANDIVLAYEPNQIVLYAGENDLAVSDTVTAEMVAQRFIDLFQFLRRNLGARVQIVFISIKPSPCRMHLFGKMVEANRLVREFIKEQQNTRFVNIYDLMMMNDSTPDRTYFKRDQLHLNKKGYALLTRELTPHLLK
jgi:lysophospholipase L1-like esterase